jgi:preprotein translocase subunit YajC
MTTTVLATIMLQAGVGTMQPLFLLGFIAILYFFMLRPQVKKQKEQKAFSAGVKVGDKVVTIGGIHGKITNINADGTMKLQADGTSYFTIEQSAISMESTVALQKRLGLNSGEADKKA